MKYTKQLSAVWYFLIRFMGALFVAIFFGGMAFISGIDIFASKNPSLPSVLPLVLYLVILLMCVYELCISIARLRKIRRRWRIELDENCMRLITPFDNSKDAFEIAYKNILKLSLEDYIGDEGETQCRWYLYTKSVGCEEKWQFELGPFSKEPIVNKLQNMCGISVVAVDLEGQQSQWVYRGFWRSLLTAMLRLLLLLLIACICLAGLGLIHQYNNPV